ncbi:glycosyltransferase [bacterium]|nr:glycosyltransferase [bacterium]
MAITFEIALFILYCLTGMCLFGTFVIIWNKMLFTRKQKMLDYYSDIILNRFTKMSDEQRLLIIKKGMRDFLYRFIELNQSIQLGLQEQKEIIRFISKYQFDVKISKGVRSLRRSKRIESIVYLGNISTDYARMTLEKELKREKAFYVKLYLINSLVEIGDSRSIPVLISSLIGSPDWFLKKANALIVALGHRLYQSLPVFIQHKSIEVKRLIIHFASVYTADDLKQYLVAMIDGDNEELALAAASSLSIQYPHLMADTRYVNAVDARIRNLAIEASAIVSDSSTIERLIPFLNDPESQQTTITSLSRILTAKPATIHFFSERFHQEKDQKLRKRLAQILSVKLEFFIVRLLERDRDPQKKLIKEVLSLGICNEVIGFLNRNTNIEIENELLSVVKGVIDHNETLLIEFRTYLDQRLLRKLNLTSFDIIAEKREEKLEKSKIITLYCLLILILLLGPTVYTLMNWDSVKNIINQDSLTRLFQQPGLVIGHLKAYVVQFNYLLVYYSTSVNLSYLLLCIFSFLGLRKQIWEWRTKKISYLFKKDILPSISVSAPAFNEEANIIESANSLLNLSYPNYELILVNDGSKDQTLNRLIDYYQLEKVDYTIDGQLNTKPVLGIYKNDSFPKLVVVNKTNGGKADSLNAGINISKMDYFCGIDADSLLEPDALLKIVTQFLDSDAEGVAVGGNILPINGCDVDKGMLTKIRLPKNHLARFQTIEYLRAFLAGRLGWAYINCLLIISGAFGLFKKDRIIQVGGYLTSSGKLKKDTVGEDMELVVRLSRLMKEKKTAYKINYSYNANCWTEVPESLKILSNQRDRWHRGLIDILFFHRKILFNPSYGSMGLFSMPYFLIFEILGPLIEVQGYLMVLIAAIFGLINAKLAILLFVSTILMGVFISIFSLIIAEKENEIFTMREVFLMIAYAVLENLGFRQTISFWRVTGYFSAMKKPKGWGTMVRKGFGAPKPG